MTEKSKFSVKFAETEEEKRATYALRYRDMLLEYREDAAHQDGLDITEYDEYGKQVICIDNETGEVVGCYRIIASDDLPQGKRFICEEEFNLDTLKATGEKIAELSRAVVKREYRNSVVLMLLLRFIMQYIREKEYRFIVGDASFFGTDKNEYVKELSYLTHYCAADDKYGIVAREEYQITPIAMEELAAAEIKRSMPPLIRAYLSFGAKVSKQSYTDREFGSVDVFVLMDMKDCNEAYIKRLLRL